MTPQSPTRDSHLRPGVGYAISVVLLLFVVVLLVLPGRNDRKSESRDSGVQQSSSPGTEIVGRPTAPGSTATPTGSLRARPRTEIERQIEEYQARVAELKAETAAFRDAHPVFNDFRQALKEKALPLMIEGAIADLRLKREYGKDAKTLLQPPPRTPRAVVETVKSVYGDITEKALELCRSGELKVGKGEEEDLRIRTEIFATDLKMFGSGEIKNVSPEEQVLLLKVEMGDGVFNFADQILSPVLNRLPPGLEDKQRQVGELYDRIQRDATAGYVTDLPKKYSDDYRNVVNRVKLKAKEEALLKILGQGGVEKAKTGE